MRYFGLSAFLSLLISSICAVCAENGTESIRGVVFVDSHDPGRSICLRLMAANEIGVLDYLFDTRRDGSFSIPGRILKGSKSWTIEATNSSAFGPTSESFLVGEMAFNSGLDGRLDLLLTTVPLTESSIKVVDQDGAVVRNVRALMRAGVPRVREDDPAWFHEWYQATDGDGFLKIRYLANGKGTFDLEIRGRGLNGNKYQGSLQVTGKRLKELGDQGVEWRVEKTPLSLTVKVQWDPDYSGRSLESCISNDTMRHVLMVKGIPETRSVIGQDGMVRFYGLLPGEHQLALSEATGTLYRISRGTEKVVVWPPTEPQPPHVVTLLPNRQLQLHGLVMDETSGQSLGGAVVLAGGKRSVTDAEGRFSLAAVRMRREDKVVVTHPGYYPLEIEADDIASNEEARWSLRSFPALGGTVMREGNREGFASARLRFTQGTKRVEATCDRLGRYKARLLPGKYGVFVEVPLRIEKGPLRQTRWAVVYDGNVEFRPVDFTPSVHDFVVADARLVDFRIDLTSAPEFPGLLQTLTFFRASDGSRVSSLRFEEKADGVHTVALQEGKYWFVLAMSGLVGSAHMVEVKKEMDLPVVLQVKKWTRFEFTRDGKLDYEGG